MKIISYCFALVLAVAMIGCKGAKKSTKVTVPKQKGVAFVKANSLTDVLERAEAQNKLVFVDFYTTWCLPCKLMDQDVFPDDEIGKFMNDNFISYKVDAEKGNGPNLAFVYSVSAYPTLVFMDAKGNVLQKKEGAAYHTELREMANAALASQTQ